MNLSSNNSISTLSDSESAPSVFVKLTSYYALVSDVATFVFNSVILTALFRAPDLRNSFMVYVIQLTISEVCLALTALPGNFVRIYYGYWPYGDSLCIAFQYFDSVLQSGVRYSHALITLNRFWAAFFPVSYRNHHNRKVACIIVALMWCFVHGIELPSVIVGRLNAKPDNKQCILDLSSIPGLVILSSIVGFNAPYFLILILYPAILLKISRLRSHRSKRNRIGLVAVVSTQARTTGQITANSDVEESRRNDVDTRGNSPYYRTLTFLTVAALICWTPNNVFYLLVFYMHYWNFAFFTAQSVLSYTLSWMNPVVLYFSLEKLRQSVDRLLRRQ